MDADEGEAQSDPQAIEVSVLIAELQEAFDSGVVGSIENGLEVVEAEVSARGEAAAREFVAAHGVPITMRTLQAFGAQPQILKRCCHLLYQVSLTQSQGALPVLSAASVASLRVAISVTPIHDVDRQADQAAGISWALCTVHNCVPGGLSVELRDEALAADAVEWLLIGCRSQLTSFACMKGLLRLCNFPDETNDVCVRRMITIGGFDMMVPVLERCLDVEGILDKSLFVEVTYAGWLLSAMHALVARAPDEASVSKFEIIECRALDALLEIAEAGMDDHAFVDVFWIEMMASTLAGFSRTVRNKRCSQEHARHATEVINRLLAAFIVGGTKPPSMNIMLHACFHDADELEPSTCNPEQQQKNLGELVAAGGVAAILKAVREFIALDETDGTVVAKGCKLLHHLAETRPPPPRIVAAAISALTLVLDGQIEAQEEAGLNGLAYALLGAGVMHDAGLRARALEAGAVESLMGSSGDQHVVKHVLPYGSHRAVRATQRGP